MNDSGSMAAMELPEDGKEANEEDELKRASMDSTKTTEDEDEALNLYKDLVEKSTGNSGKKDEFHMDGDYLILIEARKHRKTTSVEPTLWNLLEGNDENFIPARSILNKSKEELKSISEGINAEQLRVKIFEDISKKNITSLRNCFAENRTILINLTTHCYREPNSGKTALHHAIECEAWEIANYVIQNGVQALVTESFSLQIDGSHTTKNALHQLCEKGNSDVVKALINKLTPATVSEFLHRTTLVKSAGQRPREMMCMHIAALFGHDELVKLFLQMGIEADVTNKKKDTPLLWAVRGGHLAVVNTLLDQNCDVNHENDKGSTPLYWSVRYGHTHVLNTLLKRGKADVNKKRKMGFVTPLILASAMGYSEIVNILVDYGADVNVTIRNGETALQHAAAEGNQAVVKNLIVHGADVNAGDEAGNTPLTLAAKNQHAAVTYLLAAAGANLDHVTHEGLSVWHYAIESDTNDVLTGLVEYMRRSSEFYIHGIENIVQFPIGNTPLHIAAQKGDFEKVKCLLNLGVDRYSVDTSGNNFLHIAARHNNKLIIKTYGDKENINKKNSDGDTVLLIACKNGNFEAAFAALKHAKADDMNIQQETALHLVAKNRNSDPTFVEKLVNVIIKKHSWTVLDSQDDKGNTALHVAAKHATPGVIHSLQYLDIKARNQDGDNPLHIATRRGDWEVFEAFLNTFGGRGKELDYDQQNYAGESLLHIAAEKQNIQRVKQLIIAGTDVDLQDTDGNTVLHGIIISSTTEMGESRDKLLDVFVAIVENSVWWWCVKNHIKYPSDDAVKYNALKRDAVLFLLTVVKNKDDLSVLQLAARYSVSDILECIFNIREVFRFQVKNGYAKYDVTNLTPDTLLVKGVPKHALRIFKNRKLSTGNGKIKHLDAPHSDEESPSAVHPSLEEPLESLVETIVQKSNFSDYSPSADFITETVRMLDILPLNKMVGNYWSKYQWAYALLMFIHILYMSLFSVFVSDWLPRSVIKQEGANTTITLNPVKPEVWPTILILTWPIVLIIYSVYSVAVSIFFCSTKKHVRAASRSHDSIISSLISVLIYLFSSGFGLIFAIFVLVWFILYVLEDTAYQDYIVSVALILGWLYSIQFTKGFRNIHHFSLMLRHMIVKDLVKFIFLYCFVLLAFSMALHVLFRASASRDVAFPTVFHSLYFVYNIMIGMADFAENAEDSDFGDVNKTLWFMRVVYLVYTVLSNIVLLNLLIALMNDSYSTISAEQTNNWRVNSVLLALDIEREIPILPKVFYALRRQTDLCFDQESRRWYITLPLNGTDSYEERRRTVEETSRLEQAKRMDNSLERLEEKLNNVEHKLQEVVKHIDKSSSKH